MLGAALLIAGCGSEGTTTSTYDTAVGAESIGTSVGLAKPAS